MTKLSININKIATIRNARGGNNPDLLQVAKDCEQFGADGITVHPRPDERHIKYVDVAQLKPLITTEFNIEGYPNKAFVDLVLKTKPKQVTLVPDPPEVLTSNAGWDTITHQTFLKEIITEFQSNGIRTSIFIDTHLPYIEAAKTTETDRIELYTEAYAKQYPLDKEKAIAPFIQSAQIANKLELGINAGHDLDLDNLNYFVQNIKGLLEVSIGHALICDALYFGLENAIAMYKNKLNFP